MPSLKWGQHLIDSLLEFGPSMPSMSGPVAVTFSEIDAWARVTKTEMPGCEALLLRNLSKEYCHQYHISKDKDAKEPLIPGETARKQVAQGLSDVFKQLQGK